MTANHAHARWAFWRSATQANSFVDARAPYCDGMRDAQVARDARPSSADTPRHPGEHLHVLLDEAFAPYIAVAGVVLTEAEYQSANARINEILLDLQQSSYLAGLSSFDEFMSNGFHATVDTTEVKVRLVDEMYKAIPGKAFIYYSDGSRRPDLSQKKTALLLYASLAQVLLRTFRHAQRIDFHFEDHEEMGRYFEPIVEKAKSKGRVRTATKVHRCKKGSPAALALPDYILWIFGRTQQLLLRGSASQERADVRNYRAIQSHVSLIYSLESRRVANRSDPLLGSKP